MSLKKLGSGHIVQALSSKDTSNASGTFNDKTIENCDAKLPNISDKWYVEEKGGKILFIRQISKAHKSHGKFEIEIGNTPQDWNTSCLEKILDGVQKLIGSNGEKLVARMKMLDVFAQGGSKCTRAEAQRIFDNYVEHYGIDDAKNLHNQLRSTGRSLSLLRELIQFHEVQTAMNKGSFGQDEQKLFGEIASLNQNGLLSKDMIKQFKALEHKDIIDIVQGKTDDIYNPDPIGGRTETDLNKIQQFCVLCKAGLVSKNIMKSVVRSVTHRSFSDCLSTSKVQTEDLSTTKDEQLIRIKILCELKKAGLLSKEKIKVIQKIDNYNDIMGTKSDNQKTIDSNRLNILNALNEAGLLPKKASKAIETYNKSYATSSLQGNVSDQSTTYKEQEMLHQTVVTQSVHQNTGSNKSEPTKSRVVKSLSDSGPSQKMFKSASSTRHSYSESSSTNPASRGQNLQMKSSIDLTKSGNIDCQLNGPKITLSDKWKNGEVTESEQEINGVKTTVRLLTLSRPVSKISSSKGMLTVTIALQEGESANTDLATLLANHPQEASKMKMFDCVARQGDQQKGYTDKNIQSVFSEYITQNGLPDAIDTLKVMQKNDFDQVTIAFFKEQIRSCLDNYPKVKGAIELLNNDTLSAEDINTLQELGNLGNVGLLSAATIDKLESFSTQLSTGNALNAFCVFEENDRKAIIGCASQLQLEGPEGLDKTSFEKMGQEYEATKEKTLKLPLLRPMNCTNIPYDELNDVNFITGHTHKSVQLSDGRIAYVFWNIESNDPTSLIPILYVVPQGSNIEDVHQYINEQKVLKTPKEFFAGVEHIEKLGENFKHDIQMKTGDDINKVLDAMSKNICFFLPQAAQYIISSCKFNSIVIMTPANQAVNGFIAPNLPRMQMYVQACLSTFVEGLLIGLNDAEKTGVIKQWITNNSESMKQVLTDEALETIDLVAGDNQVSVNLSNAAKDLRAILCQLTAKEKRVVDEMRKIMIQNRGNVPEDKMQTMIKKYTRGEALWDIATRQNKFALERRNKKTIQQKNQ